MKRYWKYVVIGLILLATSVGVYFLHYAIFRDTHHIFIYMVGDLAFLPLEVFLVVIVLERILVGREKQAMMQKLNMVVGAFFSEVGNELLRSLLSSFEGSQQIAQHLDVKGEWSRPDFRAATSFIQGLSESPDSSRMDIDGLKALLVQKRGFMLRLLENPNLLEHDQFTDLLWATFHLAEELEARPSLKDLPATDLQHIAGDIQRVYSRLAAEWLDYVLHLKTNYPYLFSLVARTHPFQEHATAVVG